MSEKVLRLFPTPVVIGEAADGDQLCSELEAAILKKMKSDKGIVRTNVGGWHSKPDLLAWAGAAGQRLLGEVVRLADAHTVISETDRQRLGWIPEAWANVSGPGAANSPHVHGGAYWSAVFYVRVQEGPSGHLIFHDPRMPALRMHAPMLRLKEGRPEVVATVKPRAGQIIMFPSWLQHSVQAWDQSEPRISIALNLITAAQRPSKAAPAALPQPSQQEN